MLDALFFDNALRTPDADALWVDGETYTYRDLSRAANRVAAACRIALEACPSGTPARCLLFASRSVDAYAGVLGSLAAGACYIPLNPAFPSARNVAIATQSGARIVLVDGRCEQHMPSLLGFLDRDVQVVYLDTLHDDAPSDSESSVAPYRWAERRDPGDLAYILFTSGTTGEPKGVKVTHANACAYIENQRALFPSLPGIRHSQVFELTFDPSVHDMFFCWSNGGCLFVPPSADPLPLRDFILTHALTHWCSVPSAAGFMVQFRKLRADVFPSLRLSIFGGEALSVGLARAWANAAPQSRLVSVYGPTESTVASHWFDVRRDFLRDCGEGVMPLGESVPGEETVVLNAEGVPIDDDEKGELILGGRQLSAGYISDNPVDHEKFFVASYPDRRSTRWYRTGDVVSRSVEHGLLFHGRLDGQLKVRGNRVEIQEIENVVKTCSRAVLTAVVGWPLNAAGSPMGLMAFVFGAEVGSEAALAACRRRLPPYAMPDKLISLETMPLNGNGKIDRHALRKLCDTASRNDR